MILFSRKGGNCALFLPSGEGGFGQSPNWVKGLVPCGFSGQSPEPSESFSISISAIFKVLLSLIFRLIFFIGYLTLPLNFDSEFSLVLFLSLAQIAEGYCQNDDSAFDHRLLCGT